MESGNYLRSIIAGLKGKKFETYRDLAQMANVNQGNLSSFMKPDGDPKRRETMTFDSAWKILNALGLKLPTLEQQEATIRRPAPNAPVERADADGSVAIPVYALAGAGPAFDLEENDPLATIRVPLEYAMQCDSALLVKGDSMAWTIKSGGVVGVIRRNFDFVSGEVYAVRLPYEGLSIKRVIVDAASGEYIIRSDNPDKEKYPDRRLSITEYADIILGRVVWVWQAV